MDIDITNVRVDYGEEGPDGVQIWFSGRTANNGVTVNGNIPITWDDYIANSSIKLLTAIVRQNLSEIMLQDPNAEGGTEQ